MLLLTLVFAILQPAADSSLMATLQTVLGGLSVNEAFVASIKARLSNPWLMLMLSALLALVLANVTGLFRQRSEADDAHPAAVVRLKQNTVDGFVFVLFFIALALTLLVEFFYLRDSFGTRMNTVFKFYFQAWIMLGCGGAYGTWWLLDHIRKPAGRVVFATGAVLFIGLGMIYPLMAIPSRAGGFTGPANLDGASSIALANPDDWAAIQWLDANAEQGFPSGDVPVILEAPSVYPWGGSYHYEGRISTFSGFPTVLGWAMHESQWRGNYDEQGLREPDIATIYSTSDGLTMLDLLHKWNVDYVILGGPERDYITNVCKQSGGCSLSTALRKFDQVLQSAFNQGQVTIYKVP
jgi:uncharacterized membrane protein